MTTGKSSTPVTQPMVSTSNFLIATRDSGYRSTSQAIAELVDNSIQARALHVAVDIKRTENRQFPIEISVLDDGVGMTAQELAMALSFGGSSRFDDRTSLGRYGMGLPNGALSQSRRVEVYTWQGGDVLFSYLDLDEIINKQLTTLSSVAVLKEPPFKPASQSGTLVRLSRCDRLDLKKTAFMNRRARHDLARIFRRFLSNGLRLTVSGQEVLPVDPMFLFTAAQFGRARAFGDELQYTLTTSKGVGKIWVRFSELPIELWHSLPSTVKREMGVTSAPVVSVLRADREIDRGWYFMGTKRRENYDDWWRCEIEFEPLLDEAFGLTHTKQSISPSQLLIDMLSPDLEAIARALNTRVRHRFEGIKTSRASSDAECQAQRADHLLPKLPRSRGSIPPELAHLIDTKQLIDPTVGQYGITVAPLQTTEPYVVLVRNSRLSVVLNSGHPLHRDLYGPLALSERPEDLKTAKYIALSLLAAARAEITVWPKQPISAKRYRQTWGDTLATFFNS